MPQLSRIREQCASPFFAVRFQTHPHSIDRNCADVGWPAAAGANTTSNKVHAIY